MQNTKFVNCALCGADDYIVVSKKGRFNMPVRNVICKKCGLIYVNPRMPESYYKRFYSSKKYRELYDKREKPDKNYEEKIKKEIEERFQYILNRLIKLKIKKGSVLDVGCNTGYLLYLFKNKEWKCMGIEPSQDFAEYGKKIYNINIKTEFLEKAKLKEKFDLIILSHVLEHFEDPNKALSKIKRNLKSRGFLYIEVPNILKPYNNLSFFFQNAHLYTFSPNTLTAVLAKNGFKVEWLDDSGTFLKIFARSSDFVDNPIGDDYKLILSFIKKYKTKRLFLNIYDFSARSFFSLMDIIIGKDTSRKLFKYMKNIKSKI